MASKLCGEFSKMYSESLTRRKTKNLTRQNSIEFNDFGVQTRLHRIPFLRLLGTLLYVRRWSVGRLKMIVLIPYLAKTHSPSYCCAVLLGPLMYTVREP